MKEYTKDFIDYDNAISDACKASVTRRDVPLYVYGTNVERQAWYVVSTQYKKALRLVGIAASGKFLYNEL